jgi:uncharacterized membrane protein YbhN (UPF0104 family)
MRTGVLVAILTVIFGLVLPQFVNYRAVLVALQALTLPQIALMTTLGAVGYLLAGLLFVAATPTLSAGRGAAAYLIFSGIAASLPFGPWNVGITWYTLREWGLSNLRATSGIALYGLVSWLARLALPLVGLALIAATGELGVEGGLGLGLALLCAVIFAVTVLLIAGIVRSDRLADWLGRAGQRVAEWVLRQIGRPHRPDVAGAVHHFRDELGEVLRRRALAGVLAGLVAQLFWALVLLVALRLTTVPEQAVSAVGVVAVFCIVRVITILPLAPGGAGVPELLFIAGFTAVAGSQYREAIAAGVFLYRIYAWLLPIPLAWLLLRAVRRGRPLLPSAAELRALTTSEEVVG